MKRRALSVALLTCFALAACQSTHDAGVVDKRAGSDPTRAAAPPAPPAPPVHAPAGAPSARLDRIEVTGTRLQRQASLDAAVAPESAAAMRAPAPYPLPYPVNAPANTEHYAERADNPVQRAAEQPVSTFSIDVDTGSYSNVRRMLTQGVRPPADSVRAEEFINYFDYGHAAPAGAGTPFAVTTELAPAPWNAKRQLLMIGIKGYDVPRTELPPANLVLLIDTSGSMHSPDKLPLLKRAFSLLTRQMRPQDRVSIVVYAGSAGLVLPPTAGNRQGEILAALDRLEAGGSTNGGDGIRLAYAMARQGFIEGGVNRVLLATDGDFNVGTVDDGALKTMVADQRKSGIALSTLGFGGGNYNDALAEQLAAAGDGNHAYIDSVLEARKVLVEQMGATLMTIAQDVKIQIEFNPASVAEYRLIGYENRLLAREDFANDRVDAGDIGAGHQVTALYEITPVGSDAQRLPALRYANQTAGTTSASGELAHLRLRYKRPGEATSRLIETPIRDAQVRAAASDSLQFAAVVAGFADRLRGGSLFDGWSWDAIGRLAHAAHGGNAQRAELAQLIDMARLLVGDEASEASTTHAGISVTDVPATGLPITAKPGTTAK